MQNVETASPGNAAGWRTALLGVIAFAAGFWILRETMSITLPVITALLLAVGVWPMVAAINRPLPRALKWVGPTLATLLVTVLLVVFFAGLGFAAQQGYELVGNIGPQLTAWPDSLGIPAPSLEDLQSQGGGGSSSIAMSALGLTASTLGGVILILFLMVLMLSEVENWHRKFIAISPRNTDKGLREMGRSVGEKFRTYFTTRVLLGSITGALYAGWLWVFEVDYLLLWALLALLLNFIPTVGSIIAGLLPVAYAFISKDPTTAAMVAGGLLVIEQIMGNLVDPLLLGKRIALSPLVVLISLGFWTLVWGIPGAVLAVPLTVLAIIAMAQVDALRPVALLMTDRSSFEDLEEFQRVPDSGSPAADAPASDRER